MRKLITALLISTAACTAQAQAVPPQLVVSAVGTLISIVSLSLDLGDGKREYYKVQVRGQGLNFEQAKAEALRVAVAEAVGEVIASQMQVTNARLTRDEIISYSSGYVDKYEVLERKQVGTQVEVLLIVYVANSKIANRLLGNSAGAGKIDGDRHSIQITSIAEEAKNKQKLLGAVLSDYPQRAFKLTVGKAITTRLLNQRDPIYDGGISIDFPVEIEWDTNYIDALDDALKAIEAKCGLGGADANCPQPGTVRIRRNIFNVKEYGFSNWAEVSALTNKTTTNSAIQATISNTAGDPVDFRCWDFDAMATKEHIPTFGGFGSKQLNLIIHANKSGRYNLIIKVPAITADRLPLTERIKEYANVDFKIVDKEYAKCSR